MLNYTLLKNLLIIAIACSSITVTFIQKTKRFLPTSKLIPLYSLLINILGGYFFCNSFTTNTTLIQSIWVGLFAFLGADTIYTTLEGKISSYSEITNSKPTSNIVGEITYD